MGFVFEIATDQKPRGKVVLGSGGALGGNGKPRVPQYQAKGNIPAAEGITSRCFYCPPSHANNSAVF